ncbi:probable WRKY transcription factor 23 [Tanacetum coccineum]|uniref:Probable WRKY transcription factor 23 n=1 Tax=Tanacetum coccineum TaxID=301880 RepID=A0ABQ5AC10_9ASTR
MDQESFSSVLPLISASEVDQKSSSSLGFMDLLGFQDYYSTTTTSTPSLVFDDNNTFDQQYQVLPPPVPSSTEHNMHHDVKQDDDDNDHKEDEVVEEEEEESVVLSGQQQPLSPNSSCISSPAHQLLHKPNKQCMKAKKTMGGNETKTTKKKKEKEARFAFMTRTEIDHLDDGYRWRKYGQKAVKNSHFPRSYYRCTSASCNVKKRVERCMSDSSYVVTTYEGQHTHPVNSNSAPLIPSFNHLQTAPAITTTPPAMLKLDQGGLLQDMMFYHQQHH